MSKTIEATYIWPCHVMGHVNGKYDTSQHDVFSDIWFGELQRDVSVCVCVVIKCGTVWCEIESCVVWCEIAMWGRVRNSMVCYGVGREACGVE